MGNKRQINVDERVFNSMENASERFGMMEGNDMNKALKNSIKEAMAECKLSNQLYDIKEDCTKTILYFDGNMTKENREQLLAKLAEKTGKKPDSYKIVAFY